MYSQAVESKVSAQLFALEIGKAGALVKLGLMVQDPVHSHIYHKTTGEYEADVHGMTCTCPAFANRAETVKNIEELWIKTQVGVPEAMANALRYYNIFPHFPGLICKHLLAALSMAGLVNLHDELASYDVATRNKAIAIYKKEYDEQVRVLKLGKPPIRTLPKSAPIPLPVPVIEVKGRIVARDGKNIQQVVDLGRWERPQVRVLFLCDTNEAGQWDAEGSEARARAMYPEPLYKVSTVVIPASGAKGPRALPKSL